MIFKVGTLLSFLYIYKKKKNANFVSLYSQKVPESEILKAFFQFKAANLFCCEDQKRTKVIYNY